MCSHRVADPSVVFQQAPWAIGWLLFVVRSCSFARIVRTREWERTADERSHRRRGASFPS